jgi:hypothetical protein
MIGILKFRNDGKIRPYAVNMVLIITIRCFGVNSESKQALQQEWLIIPLYRAEDHLETTAGPNPREKYVLQNC